jgi:hypothetical protein
MLLKVHTDITKKPSSVICFIHFEIGTSFLPKILQANLMKNSRRNSNSVKIYADQVTHDTWKGKHLCKINITHLSLHLINTDSTIVHMIQFYSRLLSL